MVSTAVGLWADPWAEVGLQKAARPWRRVERAAEKTEGPWAGSRPALLSQGSRGPAVSAHVRSVALPSSGGFYELRCSALNWLERGVRP